MTVVTIVGRTTFIRTAGVRTNPTEARRYWTEVRRLRQATRHLSRGSDAAQYLNDLTRRYRRYAQDLLIACEQLQVSFAGNAPLSTARAKLRETWSIARANSRRALRAARQSLRTETPGGWMGPWRQWDYARNTVTVVTGAPLLCGVHAKLTNEGLEGQPGYYLARQKDKNRRRLRESKIPRLEDTRRFVSVEIECVLRNGARNALYDKLLDNNMSKYVCVKSDGSLRTDADNDTGLCIEVVVTAPIGEIETAVTGTCAALAACDAYVNQTCGLHVHLDMRNFDPKVAYSNLVAGQRVLRKLVTAERAKNTYCKPVRKRAWPTHAGRRNRYKAINAQAYSCHTTLEIRMFAGCINAEKILGYVKACYAMAYTKEAVKRAPSTMRGWQRVNPEAVDGALIDWTRTTAEAIAATH